MSSVSITEIDKYLAYKNNQPRSSKANIAHILRAFFKHAKIRGWCNFDPEAIQAPRIYSEENLPVGLSWTNVKRLIMSTETDKPKDIRDRAIIMFFAIYGLRSSEVANLRLDDIDWENNQIKILRAKVKNYQLYPLSPVVGNAIIQYLDKIRPICSYREVFLRLHAPIMPLTNSGLHHITSSRITALKIRVLHRGPHSLRHACASHLVSEGLSFKEIGDHLGHRSIKSTKHYAKIDLAKLRKVASFNFGGVL